MADFVTKEALSIFYEFDSLPDLHDFICFSKASELKVRLQLGHASSTLSLQLAVA